MTFVIVFDHGYEGYSIDECETYDEMVERCSDSPHNDIREVYEIYRAIPYEEIQQYKSDRALRKAKAVAVAKAKLTQEEIELLGIK